MTVPQIWFATVNGQTDRKSDILRWVPHLKTYIDFSSNTFPTDTVIITLFYYI